MIFRQKPLDLSLLRTTSLRQRLCRLNVQMQGLPPEPTQPVMAFLRTLPRLGAAHDLLAAAEATAQAALAHRGLIWLIDERAIDAGLSPLLVRLIHRGFIRTLALTGTAALLDYELAVNGAAREDLQPGLEDGLYGLTRETGEGMNGIINEGVKRGFGLGECLGRGILDRQPKHFQQSLMAACAARMVPCTVHLTLGVDGFHRHPLADGAMLGKGSLKDLQLLAGLIEGLNEGGLVVATHGSAALAEVFTNAFGAARNLGAEPAGFGVARLGKPVAPVADLPGQAAAWHVAGPLELIVPLFASAVFSFVE